MTDSSPTISPFAVRVLAALGEAYRHAAGPLLPPLVDGLTAGLADIDARTTPVTAPAGWTWPALFDLEHTPDPAWLGQAIGSPVPGGLSVEEARAYVRDRAYWRRGTPAAIRAAVRPLLGGAQRVTLLERDGSPWRLTVRVYAAEVLPGVTVDDIKAAALAQKPVGIVLTAQIIAGASYAHLAAEHGPTYADEAVDFPSYADAVDHLPEEGTIP